VDREWLGTGHRAAGGRGGEASRAEGTKGRGGEGRPRHSVDEYIEGGPPFHKRLECFLGAADRAFRGAVAQGSDGHEAATGNGGLSGLGFIANEDLQERWQKCSVARRRQALRGHTSES